MFIIKRTKLFLSIAGVLMIAALVSIFTWGLHPGVDFTGGTIIEVSYPEGRPDQVEVNNVIGSFVEGSFSVRATGDNGYAIRTPFLEETQRNDIVKSLESNHPIVLERLSSIGPTIGDELTQRAEIAIAVVILAIILFIAFSFRGVRDEDSAEKHRGVSSWFYGLAAIVALIFDTLIPTGAFALLGEFTSVEVDILFITALLAILGYSVNDTIVVFDRVRERIKENKEYKRHESFEETVGVSLKSTIVRSINTSLTTVIVLILLYIVGGSTTEFFALTLIIGVIAGTYSSIFIACPLLVFLASLKKRNKA